MSLKIIGAGHGRTGTNSLKLALEKLLGEPCYHMFEAIDHPEHMPVWTEAARSNPPDWHSFLEGYGATVDEPAAVFWPELMEAYPDAIVLLSVRDSEDWWRSVSRTIRPLLDSMEPGPFQEMVEAISRRDSPFLLDEDAAKASFKAHNERVKSEVPAQRLVVWKPGDGWEPICEALSLPVPGEPFPHENSADDFIEKLM